MRWWRSPIEKRVKISAAHLSRERVGIWVSVLTVIVLVAAWFIVTNTGIVGPTELPLPQVLVHEFHQS